MRLALVVVLVLVADARGGDASRLRRAELAASGPLERASLDLGGAGTATIELGLAAGETRRFVALLPAREGSEALAPRSSDEHLRFLGWTPDEERARRWSALPPALRLRPPPTPPSSANAASLAALSLAFAAAFFVHRLRARPGLALLVGAVAALGVFALDTALARPTNALVVYDYDARDGAGVRWECARDRLDFASDAVLSFAVEPAEHAIAVAIDARGDGSPLTRVVARGAALSRAEAPDAAVPDRASNRWGDFAEVWTRDADGAWTARGPWASNTALPPAVAGEARPPGWMNPALPQGLKLLVGRAASDVRGAEVWVRVLGP
ncbi:MAG: hypothetical protein K8S98_05400 [Planctomycetes bacterium]|nr:hypothetical protein [Planctomycetota bacterium]